jgi:hypothetical protein
MISGGFRANRYLMLHPHSLYLDVKLQKNISIKIIKKLNYL